MSERSNEVKVIDIGPHFKFTPEMTTEYLPGGIYTPGYDENGEFILEKMYSSSENNYNTNSEVEMRETSGGTKFFIDGEEVNRMEDAQINFIAKKSDTSKKVIERLASRSEWVTLNETADIVDKESSMNSQSDNTYDVDWVNSSYFKMENYNPGLKKADKNINSFLEKKEVYKKNNIDYRRSILFYGPPGTGKTQYILDKGKRLATQNNAVVIRIESYSELESFTRLGKNELERSIPNRLKVIVIEEISDFFESKDYQLMISNMLDSSQLRNNVIFLATTNYPERIPNNIIDRPSRLDLLIDVHYEDNQENYIFDWYKHLIGEEFPDEDKGKRWINEARANFSPAYLKELFIYSKVLNTSIENSYNRLKKRQRIIENNFSRSSSTGFITN